MSVEGLVKRNVAVLVGNGLSIAFNPELNLQSITTEVLRRLESSDGGDVVAAIKELAGRALPDGATSEEDFEILVGALGAESRTLGILDKLAGLTAPADAGLRDSIREVVEFAERVRDVGISHVLEVIEERSHAYYDEATNLRSLVTAITESFDGQVAVGNLNYDTLLLAALLEVCKQDLVDLGHGYKKVGVLVNNSVEIQVPALRESIDDFPVNKRVKLLHLHGSLTYWATRDQKVHAKVSKDLLTSGSQWRAVRADDTNIRPAVVLASSRDKAEHVAQHPFKLAYEMFSKGLAAAESWLIIGYSFRDDPVNAVLREEFMSRDSKPRVLVVTLGDDLKRDDVERAFGWGAEDDASSTTVAFISRGAARWRRCG